MEARPVIAAGMRDYDDRRAGEYDDWWRGRGLHARRERPGWDDEVRELTGVVAALAPARVLDVACGTAFLTGTSAAGDGALPFADGAYDRVFTSHFSGHLNAGERSGFLAEARRVAGELVVVDSGLLRELGGGEPLMQGRWFVAVRSPAECVGAARAEGAPTLS